MRTLRGSIVSLLLLAALTAAAPVLAGEIDEAFTQGTAALEAGKHEDALRSFLTVWKVRKTYDVAANLAQAEVQLGKHRDAAEHLSFALRNFPVTGKAALREQMEAMLAEEKKQVVTLVVRVDVDKAEVSVQGRPAGTAPIAEELFADAGMVTVEAGAAGYEPVKQTFEGKKGEARTVELKMVRKRQAFEPRDRVPAYIGGGVGLAGLVAGVVLVGLAESGKADVASKLPRDADGNLVCYKSPRPNGTDTSAECAALRSQAAEVSTMGNAGIASLVAGSVLLAGAAAYFFWPQAKAGTRAMRIVPVVGQDGAGVVWTGAF